MLHADVRQHRQERSYYISAVQPPAHAGFEDRHLDVLFQKPFEGQGGGQFKKCPLAGSGQTGLLFISALDVVQKPQ